MGWKVIKNKRVRRIKVIWKIQKRWVTKNLNGKRRRWEIGNWKKRSHLKSQSVLFCLGWASIRCPFSYALLRCFRGKKKLNLVKKKESSNQRNLKRTISWWIKEIMERTWLKRKLKKNLKRRKKRKLENSFTYWSGKKIKFEKLIKRKFEKWRKKNSWKCQTCTLWRLNERNEYFKREKGSNFRNQRNQ